MWTATQWSEGGGWRCQGGGLAVGAGPRRLVWLAQATTIGRDAPILADGGRSHAATPSISNLAGSLQRSAAPRSTRRARRSCTAARHRRPWLSQQRSRNHRSVRFNVCAAAICSKKRLREASLAPSRRPMRDRGKRRGALELTLCYSRASMVPVHTSQNLVHADGYSWPTCAQSCKKKSHLLHSPTSLPGAPIKMAVNGLAHLAVLLASTACLHFLPIISLNLLRRDHW